MKTVSIIYVDGTQHIYDDVKKVWLENSTKRYILHRIGADNQEHHTFINRENVLEFDIMDPDGWKTEKKQHNKPKTTRYVDNIPVNEEE